jgi:hypothetical protein
LGNSIQTKELGELYPDQRAWRTLSRPKSLENSILTTELRDSIQTTELGNSIQTTELGELYPDHRAWGTLS